MNAKPPVVFAARGRVGVITLARPEKFNCLSLAAHDGLAQALDAFEPDAAIRVVLLRAEGKNFCTGAELDEVMRLRENRPALAEFIGRGHAVLRRMEASRLPFIAAVQGLCLAGGLELMLACDVVFAAASSRIGDQHAQYGLVPGWGTSQRLPRIVGLRRALDLMFSARWLDAAEAERWGLVNRVVPDGELDSAAEAYCATLAERSAPGIALMKRLAREGIEQPLATGLALEEREVIDALRGADASEGLAAFSARRKPVFG